MDEKYIECAEQTTLDIVERKLAVIREKNQNLNVVGSGSCMICGRPARTAVLKGETVFTRFCSDDCRDEYK